MSSTPEKYSEEKYYEETTMEHSKGVTDVTELEAQEVDVKRLVRKM